MKLNPATKMTSAVKLRSVVVSIVVNHKRKRKELTPIPYKKVDQLLLKRKIDYKYRMYFTSRYLTQTDDYKTEKPMKPHT